jgi:hypothetical protein
LCGFDPIELHSYRAAVPDRTPYQGRNPFGSRGTTSSGAFDISVLGPATGLGPERREARAAPKKAQEGEESEFLGAKPAGKPIFFSRQILRQETLVRDYTEAGNRSA